MPGGKPSRSLPDRLRLAFSRRRADWRLWQLSTKAAAQARPDPARRPVVFFNASSRLGEFSQNAAFSLLSAIGLQAAGLPVINFACQVGLSRCVLGTNRDDPHQPPPCAACTARSRGIFAHAPAVGLSYRPHTDLEQALGGLDLQSLGAFEHQGIPLGALALPSLRWALRRHHLADDEPARFLMRQYLLSAESLIRQFADLLAKAEPQAVVVFNGIMYPEAAARWVAQKLGCPVFTHEVGFTPFSAFFSAGQATAYPLHIPADFELSAEQNARLDAYLEKRFQGKFTMAGITFWPEMHGLDRAFLERAAGFRQIVPVFTNVIYDTSQVHANVVFPHMFAWLDQALALIRSHPETLFVIRAHPDEMRPGTRKQSRESVRGWVEANRVNELPNVVFIDSQEYLSSYELISRSKFVMVYNSSIGLEASLMGAPVLCAGRARYTQLPTVFFPPTMDEHRCQAEAFLQAERIEVPGELRRNARSFLYYQLYRASLPFADYLENGPRPGFVQLKPFSWKDLHPDRCPTTRAILDGVCHGGDFLLPE
jgi:hypothetical protein